MEYRGTAVSDAISVSEIFTVLRPNTEQLCNARHGEAHPFPEIFYLSGGRHWLLIDSVEYCLREGQMIIYAPNAFHKGSVHEPENADAAILTFSAESEFLPSLYNRVISLTTLQRQRLASIVDEGMGYFCGRDPAMGVAGMKLRDGVDSNVLWGLKKQSRSF